MSIVTRELEEKAYDLNRELINCIKNGDKDRVKELIELINSPELKKYKIFSINNTINNHFGNSDYPLLVAAEHGDAEMLKIILDAGANTNVSDYWGKNAFSIIINRREYGSKEEERAFQDQKLEMIKTLLLSGYNVNKTDKFEYTALHHAVIERDERIFVLVMDCRPNVNVLNQSKETPLHLAVNQNSVHKVKSLLKFGAKLDIGNKKYASDLTSAVINGNLEITKILINAGAIVNPKREYEYSPLYYSRKGRRKNKDIEKLLLENGAKDKEQLEAETPVFVKIAKNISERFNQISEKNDAKKEARNKAKLEKNEALRILNNNNI